MSGESGIRIPSWRKKNFIPGIYNYCDRWCERCTLFHKCFLYSKDQERLKKHLAKGEDPNDWNIVMQDVKESFQEAIQLIKKSAEAQGIDLDAIPDEKYESPDPTDHPLCKHARKYMKMASRFLKRLRKILQKEEKSLAQRVEVMPSPEKDIGSLQRIAYCYETIVWYHTLVSAKIYRALFKEKIKDDEELNRIEQSDADGSAKIAYIGLTKSMEALQEIYKWDEEQRDDALTLLVEAERLRKGIDREFPGHKKFKRPGFDDTL